MVGARDQYHIYIWKESMPTLIKIIYPYLTLEMRSKINCLQSNFIFTIRCSAYKTLDNKVILTLKHKVKIKLLFYSLLLLIFLLVLCAYYLLDWSLIYCIYSETESKIFATKEVANISPSVSGNTTNIDVSKPNLHIYNPNIQIPCSMGTSLGIGGTISAGIYALTL